MALQSRQTKSNIPPMFSAPSSRTFFAFEVPADSSEIFQFLAHGKNPEGMLFTNSGKDLGLFSIDLLEKSAPLYCVGLFRRADNQDICSLLCSHAEKDRHLCTPPELLAAAEQQSEIHGGLLREWKEQCDWHRKDSRYSKSYEILAYLDALKEPPCPAFPHGPLIDLLPPCFLVSTACWEHGAVFESASNAPPPRDGTYDVVDANTSDGTLVKLVTWSPYSGRLSHPELRFTTGALVRDAFANPRQTNSDRPDDSSQSPITQPSKLPTEVILDIRFDETLIENAAAESAKVVLEKGIESIAWYQPFHVWSDDTWGIYFDAAAMDNFACRLVDAGIKNHGLSAYLALGLVYAHELFHARVDATIAFLELTSRDPRYPHYRSQVYEHLRFTEDWREEALANWSSWMWFKQDNVQKNCSKVFSDATRLEEIVRSILDDAPDGYRQWEEGRHAITWDRLCDELVTGKPYILEQPQSFLGHLLQDDFPVDMIPADIPCRFLGRGRIADLINTTPASFHVPARREIEKALRYFGYTPDPSAGKGSHVKWTGPNNTAFPLPRRDPLSYGVFKSFLNHVGIDKRKYVEEVRAAL